MQSKTITVEDICRRLRPIFGKKIDNLYLKYVMTENKQTKMEIEQALNALYQKHLSESLLNEQILLEPPQKELIGGPYPLGNVLYGTKTLYPFGLREKDWMRHVCVTGMSGSGKTNFAFHILGNFIYHKKPFLVFDWKKSFRPLTKMNEQLRLYTVGDERVANFKLNINKPPVGVEAKEWVSLLADIITETFSGSFGVHKIVVETLDKAFTEFGVYAGSGNYPTWYQIRDRIEARAAAQTKKSRESEWLESALRISYALTFGNFGKTICYKGPDEGAIEELFTEETIMELASLSNTEKKFFTQFILSYIYKWAKAGNVNTTESFKYAILVDEAHNIFLKDTPNFISESISDVIFREIREYGVSLVTLDQHISKLSDVVSGNSATNIAFQQMLPQDIEAVSRLMQLGEHKDYFTKIPVGGAIVRLVERYHDPFIIQTPLIKLKAINVPEEELSERMKLLLKHSKRRELFHKSVQEAELAKKLKDMKYLFGTSGLKTDDDFLKEQVELKEEQHVALEEAAKTAQAAQDSFVQEQKDGPAGIGLTNHVQQKILEEAKKRLLNGEKITDLKKWYMQAGYPRSDVTHTFNYIHRKGLLKKLQKQVAEVEPLPHTFTADEIQFLKIVNTQAGLAISSVYEQAGFSPRKGNEIKNKLEEAGIIEMVEERTVRGWRKYAKINYTEELTRLLTQ
jgi:hypothetical protein